MARLGRQVDHFGQVIAESIRADYSEDQRHRYTLQMEYQGDLLTGDRNETMTVILKNPSSANEQRSDSTIRKVETFVYNRFPKTRYLNIFNIFAYRATDAIELHQLMQEKGINEGIGIENDAFLKKLLNNTDNLIVAWGGPSAIDKKLYQNRITSVKDILKKNYSGPIFQVCGAKPTNEPLHGLMWGYEYELKAVTI
ncbi:MAG: DUF1643 domain-containing protein [Bacteroidales bacterium]|nr:DUF1643 domain-containing protein [Bacteroidales bacterium]